MIRNVKEAYSAASAVYGPEGAYLLGDVVFENDDFFVVGANLAIEGALPVAVSKSTGETEKWHFTNSRRELFFSGDYATHAAR